MNETFSKGAAAVEFDGQLVPVFVQDTDDYANDLTDGCGISAYNLGSPDDEADEASDCEVQTVCEGE